MTIIATGIMVKIILDTVGAASTLNGIICMLAISSRSPAAAAVLVVKQA